ncbi:MAG TPA: hypothetical protein GX404_02550 [Syntrophomonadaceae bacterium]|nr:hypothetical protein [Syntrophomonadaceae bacterium]
MNKRAIVYIALFLVLGLFIYQSQYSHQVNIPPVISKNEILNDFKDDDVPDGVGETLSVTHIFFPVGFQGQKGDVFYVTMKTGDKVLTRYYIIQEDKNNHDALDYNVKETWEDFQPPDGKYQTFVHSHGQWKEKK